VNALAKQARFTACDGIFIERNRTHTAEGARAEIFAGVASPWIADLLLMGSLPANRKRSP